MRSKPTKQTKSIFTLTFTLINVITMYALYIVCIWDQTYCLFYHSCFTYSATTYPYL